VVPRGCISYTLAAPFFLFHIRPKPTIATIGLRVALWLLSKLRTACHAYS
jgi:hypothetical protein